MKPCILFIFVIAPFVGVFVQNQATASPCEAKCAKVRPTNRSDTWKSINTICCGAAQWKAIEYSNGESYKIYRVTKTGYFYVQNTDFDHMVYYRSQADAERAVYIWSECGLFTEQGQVK